MSYFSAVKSSLKKAANDTSRLMSAQLRIEARKSGWPDDIVRHLAVHHKDGSFKVHAHDDHRSAVMDLEYGTPNQRPTAAIRRFTNRMNEAETFFARRTMKYLENHR